ncbi:hypothetical protein L3Q82_004730 [Scortum barcoo]|uniref:Uncharacterized protein n=1 Tax=Scortum barcoo TaxID=214431 RepID=A0ACB8VH87_9TELE|nr:hypothetical protein L3Q82_004730 [Scortum barcoo]
MVLDMRRERRQHQPLMITDSEVECVSSFKFLGQEGSSAAVLRLRKFGMSQRTQRTSYTAIIESILSSCITGTALLQTANAYRERSGGAVSDLFCKIHANFTLISCAKLIKVVVVSSDQPRLKTSVVSLWKRKSQPSVIR